MKLSEIQENSLSDALVDRILFEAPAHRDAFAEAAIVLGSSKAPLYRLPPVIEAYRKGLVRRIVPSGRTRELNGALVNEAELLRDAALAAGVRAEDILVENRAANTLENILFSRELLLREGLLAAGMTIAIATSSYHMRRSLLLAERAFAQDGVQLLPLPGEDRSTARDTWYTNDKGRKRCYGEIARILWALRQGLIDDWEFPASGDAP